MQKFIFFILILNIAYSRGFPANILEEDDNVINLDPETGSKDEAISSEKITETKTNNFDAYCEENRELIKPMMDFMNIIRDTLSEALTDPPTWESLKDQKGFKVWFKNSCNKILKTKNILSTTSDDVKPIFFGSREPNDRAEDKITLLTIKYICSIIVENEEPKPNEAQEKTSNQDLTAQYNEYKQKLQEQFESYKKQLKEDYELYKKNLLNSESKNESNEENKIVSNSESKNESNEENKIVSNSESKNESDKDSKIESNSESKNESNEGSKTESNSESKNEGNEGSKIESNSESKNESNSESKNETNEEINDESNDEINDESNDEANNDSDDLD